jgi:ABC-type sugar transport system substrate-binding protein
MSKTILLVLTGDAGGEVDHYQVLQEKEAVREASAASLALEIIHATGFDHLRVIRKRLRDEAAPHVDAVIIEPASVAATGLLLKQLKGETGFVLLNAWSAEVEAAARNWGKGLPFGTVSTDHVGIGRIQGRQVRALAPENPSVLCVTGPPGSSAAVQRLEGLKETLGNQGSLYETAAGYWTESDGSAAFERWYRIYRKRALKVDAVAAQSDELAMGVGRAVEALEDSDHREMLRRSPLLGVDACPDYGRKLVDTGRLTASVTTPATTGEAIRHLRDFWERGRPMPLQALTPPVAYPPARPASVA